MPFRYYISPKTTHQITHADGVQETVIGPKMYALTDPGTGKWYWHCSVIATANWVLSLVRGVDWSVIDADASCINLLEGQHTNGDGILDRSPRSLGYTNARLIRIRDRLIAKGMDTTGLDIDSTIGAWLRRAGQLIAPDFEPQRYRLPGP